MSTQSGEPVPEPADDWNWFEPTSPRQTRPSPFDKPQLEKIASRIFQSHEGRYLLDYLRAITIERTLGPDASDSLLRHLEGQRQLVAMLTKMVERGAQQPD